MSNEKNVVILAAGDGTRMKSKLPKVMCEVLQKPMLKWVLDACKEAGIFDVCVILGNNAEVVEQILDDDVTVVYQHERLGTGHAALQALDFMNGCDSGNTLILVGDSPLMDAQTIKDAYEFHVASNNSATVITAQVEDPTGYGRIVHKSTGNIHIVEQADASDAIKKIREINSGSYWFKTKDLIEILPKITNENAKGEYYLTDAMGLLADSGKQVDAYRSDNPDVVLGANNLRSLHELNEKAKSDIIYSWIELGVEFVSFDGVIISPDVELSSGVKILPGTILRGMTKVGEGSIIGPNSVIEDSEVGSECIINQSQIYGSVLKDGVKIGPFTHIRPGCILEAGCKIGSFVEVKNSRIGARTSAAHLTYIGDSDVGEGVNFGCGVVTANYDGKSKNRTVIGDGAFIGCNTNLIAPVVIGEGAYTAAGSTITDDVGPKGLAIARSRQINKADYVKSGKKD